LNPIFSNKKSANSNLVSVVESIESKESSITKFLQLILTPYEPNTPKSLQLTNIYTA
jgi:hypothetical protein